MKVILFQSYETGANYHAAELEILQKHIDAGDDVTLVSCRSIHCGCDYNPTQNKLHCFTCKHQTKRGNKLLTGKYEERYYDNFITNADIVLSTSEVNEFEWETFLLRDKVYKSYDIGMATLSTIISRTRDPDVDLIAHREEAEKLAQIGLLRFIVTEKILDEYSPDLVYFFNGRHTAQRAIRRACEARNIDYASVEGGHNLQSYGIFKNSTPHDIKVRTKEMLDKWGKDSEEEREERGAGFFEKRRSGHSSWGVMKSFTNNQTKGKLPEGWDENKKNIAIYCSSEDEYVAVGEQWQCQVYKNQLQGWRKMSEESAALNGELCFYLRMHPNLKGIVNDFVKAVRSLEHEYFVVIDPESDVSSYDLMVNADISVAFGSTAGLEAAYWGKPSILLGSSFYMYLDVVYTPQNHEEFMQLLLAETLIPMDNAQGNAKKYSNYFLSFGIDYENSEAGASVTEVKYKGVYLNGNWLIRHLLAFRNKLITSTIDYSVKKAQKANARKS